jgi:transcriptional regulator with XRE-family HTH domain
MKTIARPYSSSAPKIENIGEPHTMVRSFAPFVVMVAGTGGLMTAHSAAKMPRYCCVGSVLIHIEDPHSAKQEIDTRSTSEHVANIRNVFAMNMSDLAAVFAVTRPTVYAWLEGRQEPKPEAVKRIQQLSSAADEFGKANIKRLDKLLHRPILDGDSLLDILKANEDPLAVLPLLKEISEKEAKTRREPKGSGKYRRSLDDVLGESSVAIDLQG